VSLLQNNPKLVPVQEWGKQNFLFSNCEWYAAKTEHDF